MTSESFSSRAELVTKPGPHDVLCGRGRGINNHCGNVKFRELVNEHKPRYLAAKKVEKPKVAREVVQLWRAQDPPGRFLARKDNSRKGPGSVKAPGNIWYDVGDKKARDKASQCCRERTPDMDPFVRELQRQQDVLTAFGLHVLECQTSLKETTREEDTLKKAGDALAAPGGNVASAMQRNSQFASSHQDNFNSRLNHPYPLQWGERPTPSRPGYLADSVISSGLQSQDMSLRLQKQNQALHLETASHQQDQGLASTSPMSTTHKNMMLQLLLAQQDAKSSAEVPQGDLLNNWTGPDVKKFFDGFGWLAGNVTACNGENFQVTYENGCIEENSSEELSEIMITPNLAKVEIGSRLAVFHPDECKYYEATVTCERNEKRPLRLEYVNGGHEWVDLRQYKFQLLPGRTVSRNHRTMTLGRRSNCRLGEDDIENPFKNLTADKLSCD